MWTGHQNIPVDFPLARSIVKYASPAHLDLSTFVWIWFSGKPLLPRGAIPSWRNPEFWNKFMQRPEAVAVQCSHGLWEVWWIGLQCLLEHSPWNLWFSILFGVSGDHIDGTGVWLKAAPWSWKDVERKWGLKLGTSEMTCFVVSRLATAKRCWQLKSSLINPKIVVKKDLFRCCRVSISKSGHNFFPLGFQPWCLRELLFGVRCKLRCARNWNTKVLLRRHVYLQVLAK